MNIADFKPGVYRHYKGNYYLALGLALIAASVAASAAATRMKRPLALRPS